MIHADVLGERARLTPRKTALIDAKTGASWTHEELDERAQRMAALWQRLGLKKGDRVALLAHNRPEFLDAFFAGGKSGIVLVPLGTRLTAKELTPIVQNAEPTLFLYDGELAETVQTLREHLDESSIQSWIALDDPIAEEDPILADLLAETPAEFERPEIDGEDLYCLLYTSGTTGLPKGVMIPHRQVAWNGYNTVASWQLQESDISTIFTPLYHAGGLMVFLVPLFVIGGTIVLHRHFDADEVWRTIEKEGCTVLLAVPTIYKMLRESPLFPTVDLRRVRWLISGGAPLPNYLIEAYQKRGVTFKQGFGMTEVGVNGFAMTVEDSIHKVGSIGKPMMFTEVRLVDENGEDVATGEVGEMWFRGAHVCRGYWRNEEATRKALDEEGWFHSGDLAKRDGDGYFYVAGREKDMLISGGVNIYPAEIESALLLHPKVEDAAVVGVPHERWGEVSVAFLVTRAEDPPSPEDLNQHLEEHLARYKLPRDYRIVDALPRTGSGKIAKRALRDAPEEPRERPQGEPPAR